jgi:hypothetical protein
LIFLIFLIYKIYLEKMKIKNTH